MLRLSIFSCCDHKTSSREVVENCVEKCNSGMKNAQRTLEKELGGLQARNKLFRFLLRNACYCSSWQRSRRDRYFFVESSFRKIIWGAGYEYGNYRYGAISGLNICLCLA